MSSQFSKKEEYLFSFHKLNKYFLFPFFVPIICFTTKFFSETMKTDNDKIKIKDVSIDNTHTFVFLYQIIQSICLILGGLLYFITIYLSRSRNSIIIQQLKANPNIDNINRNIYIQIALRKNYSKQKDKIKKNIIILFMPLLIIVYNMGIAYGVNHPELEKRVYFLFFITLMNIFIFKKKLFKHQKCSLIITAIGIIPIYLAFGLYLNTDEYSIYYDIFLFIGSFCYSLYLVLIKYMTLNKGMNIFLLLLYQGLLCFGYTIIIFSIISYIAKGDLTYIINIFYCSETNYICISYYYFNIIMYLILNTVLQTLIFLVVYFFSPELFAISDIFSPLFSFIALCIQTKETNTIKISLNVLGYLIIALASFLYNEIIVCNFCGLNENTWKAIDKKAYIDLSGRGISDSFAIHEDYKIDEITDNFDNDEDIEDRNDYVEMGHD